MTTSADAVIRISDVDVAGMLTGQHVRLWPYSRGFYSRDLLYRLWRLMEDEQGADKLFYAQHTTDPLVRGDLVEFVRYFDAPGQRLLLIVQRLVPEELVGFWWFDEIAPGFKASANIFMAKTAWGHASHEATVIACRYGFEALGLRDIWAYTPWVVAANHAMRCGFAHEAVLKGFARLDRMPLDIHVLRLRRPA